MRSPASRRNSSRGICPRVASKRNPAQTHTPFARTGFFLDLKTLRAPLIPVADPIAFPRAELRTHCARQSQHSAHERHHSTPLAFSSDLAHHASITSAARRREPAHPPSDRPLSTLFLPPNL